MRKDGEKKINKKYFVQLEKFVSDIVIKQVTGTYNLILTNNYDIFQS